jgi:hypothetical protein
VSISAKLATNAERRDFIFVIRVAGPTSEVKPELRVPLGFQDVFRRRDPTMLVFRRL